MAQDSRSARGPASGVRRVLLTGARAALGASLAGLLYAIWPAALLAPIGLVGARLSSWINPWMEVDSMEVRGRAVQMGGTIRAEMTLADGARLPAGRGSWRQGGMPYATMAAVASAVFAGMAGRIRITRVIGFAAFLVCAGGAGLAISIQRSALEGMGTSWLPAYRFADRPENVREFERMRSWYRATAAADSVLGGGGLLFLGVAGGIFAAAGSRRPPRPAAAGVPESER